MTHPPPPPGLVTHVILYLERRIAKGDYPPAGWLEWLDDMQQALAEGEAEQLRILVETDLDRFIEREF